MGYFGALSMNSGIRLRTTGANRLHHRRQSAIFGLFMAMTMCVIEMPMLT